MKPTVERNDVDADEIVHVRDYRSLRQIARDWQTFSNDALGRIQIPAEDKTRSFRQFPIESDPPQHTASRAIVQQMFNQPFDPNYAARIVNLVETMISGVVQAGDVEVVEGFALPLQSRALAHLLGMPIEEADLWVSWGLHAFRAEKGYDLDRAQRLVDYIADRLERAPREWPESLFAQLRAAKLNGAPLPNDLQMGFAHLVFAGGRDTVIRLIAGGIAHLARTPGDLDRLKADPALANTLTEELVRFLSPLPYLGRVCTRTTEIDTVPVAAGQRVALCFRAANRDPAVFSDPDRVVIDRSPNPHVGFGSGPHSCLGSAHARLLSRTVLHTLARRVERLALLDDLASDLEVDKLWVRFHEA